MLKNDITKIAYLCNIALLLGWGISTCLSLDGLYFLAIVCFWGFNLFIQMVIFDMLKGDLKEFLILFPISFVVINLLASWVVILLGLVIPVNVIYLAVLVYFLLISAFYMFGSSGKRPFVVSVKREHLVAIIVLSVGFTLSRVVFYSGMTSGSSFNMDSFGHLIAIKEIFINHNHSLFLTDLNSFFTINSYLPIFHCIFGLPLWLGGQVNFVTNYLILEMSFALFSAIWVFVAVDHYSHNVFAGVVSSLFHVFCFEGISAYSSFFLLPQTLVYFLGFLAFMYVACGKVKRPWVVLASLVVLTAAHFLIGAIWSVIIIATYVVQENLWIHINVYRAIYVLLWLVLLVFYAANQNLVFIHKLIMSDFESRKLEFINLGFSGTLTELFRTYGFYLLFLIVAQFKIFFSKNRIHLWVMIMIFFIIGINCLSFLYATKLLGILHYLVIVLVSFVVTEFEITSQRLILSILMVTGFCFVLIYSSSTYKDTIKYKDNIGFIMSWDYEAIKYVKNKGYSQVDTIVVSDPLTMSMIEPLIQPSTTGGLFTKPEIREQIWRVLNQNSNPSEFKTFVQDKFGESKSKIVFVITPRTEEWVHLESSGIRGYLQVIWKPVSTFDGGCGRYDFLGDSVAESENYCVFEL